MALIIGEFYRPTLGIGKHLGVWHSQHRPATLDQLAVPNEDLAVPLSDIFVRTAILDGGPALGKEELIGSLVRLLAEAGDIAAADIAVVVAAALRRERLGSMGVGGGLALPHARWPGLVRPVGVLAVCRPSVEYESLDGEPVDLVALILSPPDRSGAHLGRPAPWAVDVVRRLRDPEFRRRLRRADSATEVAAVVHAEDGMTRREWAACTDPAAMLRLLGERNVVTARKARLFGAACCRLLWAMLPAEGRHAVEVAERHADGLAGRQEMDAVRQAFTAGLGRSEASPAAVAVSYLLSGAGQASLGHAADVAARAALAAGERAEASAGQADLIRCVFGLPFATRLDSNWLTPTVVSLARGVYDDRAFDRLPILGDALEDAGCVAGEMLDHLRGPGPHCRGCRVVDAILGNG